MALQSPTTLLNSIQYMKNKLRNDKQTLMDIKNDFTRFAKKPHSHHHDPEDFVLNDITPNPNHSQSDPSRPLPPAEPEKQPASAQTDRGRVLQLKREQQRELARMREEHAREMAELLRVKNLELEDVEGRWRGKLEEQASYISLLEEQVSSPIQTERERVPLEQYDAIINKLLQENTRLHDSNARLAEECERLGTECERLGTECERLRRTCSQLDSERTKRSRFRFGKGREEGKASQYVSEVSHSQVQPPLHHRRASSVYIYNDENVDRSNCVADRSKCNEWEDIEIHDEEGGLRTIRQFEKSVLEDNSFKMNGDGFHSLKV